MKATLKELQTAAKELNKVLDLEPAISLAAKEKVLVEKIQEAIELIDPEADTFSKVTQKVIDELTPEAEEEDEEEEEEEEEVVVVPAKGKKAAPAPVAPAKGKKAAPVVEEEDEDEDEEDVEASLYDQVKAAAKNAELKALVAEHVEFKKLRKIIDTFKNAFILKKAMTDILEEGDPSLLAAKAAKAAAKVKDPNAPAKKNPFKKEPGVLSFQETADKLLADKADAKTILKTFVALYKDRKNVTDEKFVQGRADIYMKIAAKGK